MKKISINHVNNVHNDWLRALDFYKEELSILKGRLGEVASKNTSNDVLMKIEHYENVFSIQRDNIDRLIHFIKLNISEIAKAVQTSSAGYIDNVLLIQHNNLQERFELEEKVVNEIRQFFNQFAAEWM